MSVSFRQLKTLFLASVFLACVAAPASAIPNLQIYIPGAEYDMASETWVIDSYSYDLHVVGANLDINDVKIAIAVPEDEDGSITLSWSTPDSAPDDTDSLVMTEIGGMEYSNYFASYSDPNNEHVYSTYAFGVADDGDYPLMGDGSQLAGHGVFPTDFYEYYIGDFGTTDPIYNFNPPDGYEDESYYINYPDDLDLLDTGWGETKIFNVEVQGYTWADIVAYNHVEKTNGTAKYVFSPFSHDGGGGSTPVPEPTTLLLLGTGLIGLAGIRRKITK